MPNTPPRNPQQTLQQIGAERDTARTNLDRAREALDARIKQIRKEEGENYPRETVINSYLKNRDARSYYNPALFTNVENAGRIYKDLSHRFTMAQIAQQVQQAPQQIGQQIALTENQRRLLGQRIAEDRNFIRENIDNRNESEFVLNDLIERTNILKKDQLTKRIERATRKLGSGFSNPDIIKKRLLLEEKIIADQSYLTINPLSGYHTEANINFLVNEKNAAQQRILRNETKLNRLNQQHPPLIPQLQNEPPVQQAPQVQQQLPAAQQVQGLQPPPQETLQQQQMRFAQHLQEHPENYNDFNEMQLGQILNERQNILRRHLDPQVAIQANPGMNMRDAMIATLSEVDNEIINNAQALQAQQNTNVTPPPVAGPMMQQIAQQIMQSPALQQGSLGNEARTEAQSQEMLRNIMQQRENARRDFTVRNTEALNRINDLNTQIITANPVERVSLNNQLHEARQNLHRIQSERNRLEQHESGVMSNAIDARNREINTADIRRIENLESARNRELFRYNLEGNPIEPEQRRPLDIITQQMLEAAPTNVNRELYFNPTEQFAPQAIPLPERLPTTLPPLTNNNVNWKVQANYDVANEAKNLAAIGYAKLPSAIPKMTTLQQVAAMHVEKLLDQANDDSYNLARREIGESFSRQHMRPLLQKTENASRPALSPEDAGTMNAFKEHYNDMGRAILSEMGEHYLRDIAPQANFGFMQNGMWNSPLRAAHQGRVLGELQKNVARELTKLHTQGFEKGLQQVGEEKQRALSSAQLAHNLISNEKQMANVGAKNLQDLERQQFGFKVAQIGATQAIGEQEQKQKAAIMAEKRQEAAEQQNFPIKQLAIKSGFINEAPNLLPYNPDVPTEIIKPSSAGMVSGILGNLAGSLFNTSGGSAGNQNNALSRASGGIIPMKNIKKTDQHINIMQHIQKSRMLLDDIIKQMQNKYADGGIIDSLRGFSPKHSGTKDKSEQYILRKPKENNTIKNRYADEDYRLPDVQLTPQMRSQEENIEEMRNTERLTPVQIMLAAIAKSAAAQARKHNRSYGSEGEGMVKLGISERDREKIEKERAMNIRQKIIDSQAEQQKVTGKYQQDRKDFAETVRHNRAVEEIASQAKYDNYIKGLRDINPDTGRPYTLLEKERMKAEAHNSVYESSEKGKAEIEQKKINTDYKESQKRKNDEALRKGQRNIITQVGEFFTGAPEGGPNENAEVKNIPTLKNPDTEVKNIPTLKNPDTGETYTPKTEDQLNLLLDHGWTR